MTTESRYQRVRRILDEASAGSCQADYQGYGDFWNLPYEEFLDVEIFGVRMIAPSQVSTWVPPDDASTTAPATTPRAASSGGCCGGNGATASPPSAAAAGPASAGDRPAASAGTSSDETSKCLVRESGRGARSGLIIGLQGAFPFDGSQFQRLMWGGQTVSASDILFISDWIDDGCPANDDIPICPDPPQPPGWQAVCGIDGSFKTINDHQDDNGKPKVRKNYESLTPEEACKLRYAFGALRELNRYPADNRSFNYWGKVHGDHCEHGWEVFLPWHRAYLYRFELAIQQVVPGVTLPYWDWTMPMYLKGAVPSKKGSRKFVGKGRPQSGVLPTLLRCYIDERALEALRNDPNHPIPASVLKALTSLETDSGGSDPNLLYNSLWELFVAAGLGADDFADWSTPVATELQKTNPLWNSFRYPGMFYQSDAAGNPLWKNGYPVLAQGGLESNFHHHYATADEVAQILALNNWHDFGGGHFEDQSFGVLSQNPHNTGHIWSGGANPFFNYAGTNPTQQPQWGDMFTDLNAFYDPIGYAHHSNVDRLFWKWQTLHPGQNPDDLTAYMVPFQMTVNDLLKINKLGYEYVSDATMHATDRNQEITHLATDPVRFAEHVTADPQRVEIRFHNVLRAVQSFNVRVFLNQPGADVNTPTQGNDAYVGFFGRFGHGPCVGGPGHCEPPGPPSRFEIPVRHHNTPHNYRLDATDNFRKLVAQGAKDFQVNAVVLGGDGQAREGLKLDGVSLHVID